MMKKSKNYERKRKREYIGVAASITHGNNKSTSSNRKQGDKKASSLKASVITHYYHSKKNKKVRFQEDGMYPGLFDKNNQHKNHGVSLKKSKRRRPIPGPVGHYKASKKLNGSSSAVVQSAVFSEGPWLKFCYDFMIRPPMVPAHYVPLHRPTEHDPRKYMDFATIKDTVQAGLKGKVPFTAGIINFIKDTKVVLSDPSGTMHGTLDLSAMDLYGSSLGIGSCIVLQHIALFTPRRNICYLNITHKNIVCVVSAGTQVPPPLTGVLKKLSVEEEHEDELMLSELALTKVNKIACMKRLLKYIVKK